jgi:GxxExxY protein
MNAAPDPSLTHQIIGLAMRVHTRLGPGLLESVYERYLCHELGRAPHPYRRQVELPLAYDDVLLDCGYRADIIVNEEVLLELKSVERILPLHGPAPDLSASQRLPHWPAAQLQHRVAEGWHPPLHPVT